MLYIQKVSAIRVQEPSGLRICWQKFPILKPKNIRTYLAKQDHTGSCMWGTVKL